MPILKQFSKEGFWLSTLTDAHLRFNNTPLLKSYDTVVVGGGFTGLSAAIALAERGERVALFDRGRIASGASGYNCGQVGIQLGINPRYTLKYLGLERTKAYAATLQEAIANVREMVTRSGVECHYNEVGNLTTGVHESQRRIVEETCRACDDVGLPVKMLTEEELSSLDIPRFVDSAFHELIGGAIHPAKYAHGLAKIASALGVDIVEDCSVHRVEPGPKVDLHLSDTRVRADKCVIATNAYSAELGFMKGKYIPYSVSVLVSEQLTPEQRQKIGWRDAHPLHTPHKMIENIRLTHDGRILVGTKRARLGLGNRHPTPDADYPFRALARVLKDRFPEIPELRPDTGWTGRIALAPDGIPFFTTATKRPNIVFGGAYGGHGIAMASYSGRILAGMLYGDDLSQYEVFIKRKRPPLPPEPLRWILGQSVGALMKHSDNKIDARARRQLSDVKPTK